MFLQLNPPLPLVTPKGKAWAVGLIDYGPQWDLQWITFLHDSGECWTFLNRDIRQEDNYTFGIGKPSAIAPHKPANGNAPLLNGHARPVNASTANEDEPITVAAKNTSGKNALGIDGHDGNAPNGHDHIPHDYADTRRPMVNGH